MIARGRIDIGWSDLLAGAAACLSPGHRRAAQARVEASWSSEGDALACLSIRSGLDLLLTALAYPRGSEVLVSAVTIRDMVRVLEEHGLVPVPVDLDMATLTVKAESLARALSPRTRAVLVAHLFGSRMPLDEVSAFARTHGLLLIEDCAQSFTGRDYTGDAASDVAMFSFGPIKTCTALGGALFRVRDGALRDRMREVQGTQPVQGRMRFLRRVARFFVLRLLMQRLPYSLLCRACRLCGRSHDDVVSHAVRGFSGPDFFANIRHQPSYPLLSLLSRRLARFDGARVARRMKAAADVFALAPDLPRPGSRAPFHSYWAFPTWSSAPDDLVRALWRRGFDATRGQWSLYCLPAPAGGSHLEPTAARDAMRRVVYLPVYPEVPAVERERLARSLLALQLTPDAAAVEGFAATARARR